MTTMYMMWYTCAHMHKKYTHTHICTYTVGSREMSQQLRVASALLEDPSLLTNTHMVVYKHL